MAKIIQLFNNSHQPVYLDMATGNAFWLLPYDVPMSSVKYISHMSEERKLPYYEKLYSTDSVSWSLPLNEMSDAAITRAKRILLLNLPETQLELKEAFNFEKSAIQMTAIDDYVLAREKGDVERQNGSEIDERSPDVSNLSSQDSEKLIQLKDNKQQPNALQLAAQRKMMKNNSSKTASTHDASLQQSSAPIKLPSGSFEKIASTPQSKPNSAQFSSPISLESIDEDEEVEDEEGDTALQNLKSVGFARQNSNIQNDRKVEDISLNPNPISSSGMNTSSFQPQTSSARTVTPKQEEIEHPPVVRQLISQTVNNATSEEISQRREEHGSNLDNGLKSSADTGGLIAGKLFAGCEENKPVVRVVFDAYTKDTKTIDAQTLLEICYDFGVFYSLHEIKISMRSCCNKASNVLTYENFMVWWRSNSKVNTVKLSDPKFKRKNAACILFKRYDPSRDGSISVFDFSALHTSLVEAKIIGPSLTAVDCISQLVQKDSNDQTINFVDYVNWIESSDAGDDSKKTTFKKIVSGIRRASMLSFKGAPQDTATAGNRSKENVIERNTLNNVVNNRSSNFEDIADTPRSSNQPLTSALDYHEDTEKEKLSTIEDNENLEEKSITSIKSHEISNPPNNSANSTIRSRYLAAVDQSNSKPTVAVPSAVSARPASNALRQAAIRRQSMKKGRSGESSGPVPARNPVPTVPIESEKVERDVPQPSQILSEVKVSQQEPVPSILTAKSISVQGIFGQIEDNSDDEDDSQLASPFVETSKAPFVKLQEDSKALSYQEKIKKFQQAEKDLLDAGRPTSEPSKPILPDPPAAASKFIEQPFRKLDKVDDMEPPVPLGPPTLPRSIKSNVPHPISDSLLYTSEPSPPPPPPPISQIDTKKPHFPQQPKDEFIKPPGPPAPPGPPGKLKVFLPFQSKDAVPDPPKFPGPPPPPKIKNRDPSPQSIKTLVPNPLKPPGPPVPPPPSIKEDISQKSKLVNNLLFRPAEDEIDDGDDDNEGDTFQSNRGEEGQGEKVEKESSSSSSTPRRNSKSRIIRAMKAKTAVIPAATQPPPPPPPPKAAALNPIKAALEKTLDPSRRNELNLARFSSNSTDSSDDKSPEVIVRSNPAIKDVKLVATVDQLKNSLSSIHLKKADPKPNPFTQPQQSLSLDTTSISSSEDRDQSPFKERFAALKSKFSSSQSSNSTNSSRHASPSSTAESSVKVEPSRVVVSNRNESPNKKAGGKVTFQLPDEDLSDESDVESIPPPPPPPIQTSSTPTPAAAAARPKSRFSPRAKSSAPPPRTATTSPHFQSSLTLKLPPSDKDSIDDKDSSLVNDQDEKEMFSPLYIKPLTVLNSSSKDKADVVSLDEGMAVEYDGAFSPSSSEAQQHTLFQQLLKEREEINKARKDLEDQEKASLRRIADSEAASQRRIQAAETAMQAKITQRERTAQQLIEKMVNDHLQKVKADRMDLAAQRSALAEASQRFIAIRKHGDEQLVILANQLLTQQNKIKLDRKQLLRQRFHLDLALQQLNGMLDGGPSLVAQKINMLGSNLDIQIPDPDPHGAAQDDISMVTSVNSSSYGGYNKPRGNRGSSSTSPASAFSNQRSRLSEFQNSFQVLQPNHHQHHNPPTQPQSFSRRSHTVSPTTVLRTVSPAPLQRSQSRSVTHSHAGPPSVSTSSTKRANEESLSKRPFK